MQHCTVFTDSRCLKCSWAHVIMSFIQSHRLLDRRPWAFSDGFQACPLLEEISPDSFNLLRLLWIVDVNIHKSLAMYVRKVAFNCSSVYASRFSPHSCCEQQLAFHTWSCYHYLLPVNRLPVECPKQVFCYPISIFLVCVTCIKFRMSVYLPKHRYSKIKFFT